MDAALGAIAGPSVTGWISPRVTGERVIKSYTYWFRQRPLVVLSSTMPDDNTVSYLKPAAQSLTTRGVAVIVDTSTSSSYANWRDIILRVELMTFAELNSVPKFAGMFAQLKKCGLFDTVWGVLGGSPRDWGVLKKQLVRRYHRHCIFCGDLFC